MSETKRRANKGRPKTPREEAPKLVGLTKVEAAQLERAAALCDIPCAQFIREASLSHAAKLIKVGGR